MSICCTSGKARIFYNIPFEGGLKYKTANKWKMILAREPLTTTCIKLNKAYSSRIERYTIRNDDTVVGWISPLGSSVIGAIPTFVKSIYDDGGVDYWYIKVTEENGNVWYETTYPAQSTPRSNFYATDWRLISSGLIEGDQYKFTITGTETGTKYLEIEVDECPDVQTIPCKFDPAKEQYIDVEMIPYTELPIPLPNYPLDQDCIEITRVGNFTVVEKVTKRNYGPTGDSDPTVRETRKILLVLDSAENCPPPQVRVECCPKGICGEDKKCPKGTTCEIVCNGFKCCYRNGKLIRSIKL